MMNTENAWVPAAALMALLGAGAFWDGLYGSAQQLVPAAVLALVSLQLRSGTALSRPEAVGLLLLLAGVGGSLVAPASAGSAAHGPALLAMWVLAFLLGRHCAASGALERSLGRTWAFTAPLMVFGGLVAMSYLPVHHSARLASFLGYPIAVGMLGLLGLAGALPDLQAGRWWAAGLACGSAAGLLLSGSRGVWAAAFVLGLYLLWMAPGLLRRAFWPAAGALAAALWAGPAVAARAPLVGLTAVLLACLTVLLVDRFRQHGAAHLGAALAWVAAVAVAPGWGWLMGRATALSLAEGSSVERLAFFRDGLALVRQWPWGAGHRGWAALHLQGSSYGYYSAEVHSSLLDMTLSFGWLGGLGFALLLGLFFVRLRHGRDWTPVRVAVLGGLGALGLHSLVDWDLSYGLFAVPLWIGFGLAAPERPLAVTIPFPVRAGLAGVTLAGVVLLGAGDLAGEAAQRALAAGAPEKAYLHAGLGVTVNPWSDLNHGLSGQALAAMGEREAALGALSRARQLNPYEPWYAELNARELLMARRWPEAAAAYRELVGLWPWHVPVYEAALEAHMEMSLRAAMDGDDQLLTALRASAQEILAALEAQKAREPVKIPRPRMQVDTPAVERATRFYR